MSFAAGWRLAELNEDEQRTATGQIMANQLTKGEVGQIVELKKRSGRPITECIGEVLRMRPSVIRKYVFLGAVVGDVVKLHLMNLRQSERDAMLSTVLKNLYGQLPKTSARLGVDRFTIVTDEQGASQLKQVGRPTFEAAINRSLAETLPKT